MSYIPRWATMSKWQLKLMDLMTPAETVQRDVDHLLNSSYEVRVSIEGSAVFLYQITGSTADHPKRFPLSKLRKDQLDKLYEIIKKQHS